MHIFFTKGEYKLLDSHLMMNDDELTLLLTTG